MKVYISGKIGEKVISEATRQKFAKAEEVLKAMGYDVFNPCREEWDRALRDGYRYEKFPDTKFPANTIPFYSYALLRDQMVLSTCEAICLLPDWKDSPGAKAELAFAHAIGLKVYELNLYGSLAAWAEEGV